MEPEELLRQIKRIDGEISALNEQRQELRLEMLDHLRSNELTNQRLRLNDDEYRVSRSVTYKISYDTALLRNRLGPRFKNLLQVDKKKVTSHLAEVTQHLMPIIEQVGSITEDTVKRKIKSGEFVASDFIDAFVKTEKETLYIRRVPQ